MICSALIPKLDLSELEFSAITSPGWGERQSAKTVRPGRKRELVAQTCGEWNVSIRRAYRGLEFDTSSCHYKSRRRAQAGSDQGDLRDTRALWLPASSDENTCATAPVGQTTRLRDAS